VYRRHDPDEEVEANAVTGLKAHANRFSSHAGDTHLAVGLVGEPVVQVVRQLAVDADRLQAMEHGISGSLEHSFGLWALGYRLPATGHQLQ
jgi:hypothetical protein